MSDRGCNYYPVDPAAFLEGLRSPTPLTQEDLKNEENVSRQVDAPQPVAPPAQQNLDERQQLVHQIFRTVMMSPPPATMLPILNALSPMEFILMAQQAIQESQNGVAQAASGSIESSGNNTSTNPANGDHQV
ncbi:unnamed protein product [Caenorhabditis brenneri]